MLLSTVILTTILLLALNKITPCDQTYKKFFLSLSIALCTNFASEVQWYFMLLVIIQSIIVAKLKKKIIILNHQGQQKQIYVYQESLYWKILLVNIEFAIWLVLTLDFKSVLFNQQNVVFCVIICISSVFVLYMLSVFFNNFPLIIQRKIFHIVPFLFILYLQTQNKFLLHSALGLGFYLLFTIEILRFCILQHNFPYFLRHIIHWMTSLNGKREPNFWYTHLLLYLSIMISFSNPYINSKIGLILMVADGMAAVIGSKFGTHFLNGKKTIEGSLAYMTTYLIGLFIIHFRPTQFLWSDDKSEMMDWSWMNMRAVWTALGAAAVEQYSGDADNIAPLLLVMLMG